MKELNGDINVETEVKAIIDFVSPRWDIKNSQAFEVAVRHAFTCGLEIGAIWGQGGISSSISNARHERTMWVYDDCENRKDDKGLQVLNALYMSIEHASREFMKNWDYTSRTAKLLRVLRQLDGIDSITPRGYGKYSGLSYDELKNAYEDFDTFEYFDGEFDKQKDAAQIHTFSYAGGGALVERIALHNTLYDDTNQGRKPCQVLFSAIFTHGLRVGEHNATHELIKQLNELELPDETMHSTNEQLEQILRNPFAQAAIQALMNG